MMTLKKHIPSHISIAGYRALTSYHGQPQTCYRCGDTDHMHHICPKHRKARSKTTAPFNHTWANIVASTPPTSDMPDTSDVVTMDTTLPPPTMGELTPSVTSKERDQPVPASIDDSQCPHETKPSQVSTPPTHDNKNPIQHQWADEDPELEQNLTGGKTPAENAQASIKKWPPLPSLNAEHRDAHSSHPPTTPPTTDADGTPEQNDISTAPRTEHMTAEVPRPGMTRKKRLRTDKPGEPSQDRKRNRTRTLASTKEK